MVRRYGFCMCFLLENIDSDHFLISGKDVQLRNMHINIGTGVDISIKELAEEIKSCVGYNGDFNYNITKPDGTMKKLTDVSKLHQLGWKHSVSVKEGIKKLYSWYLAK